MAEEKEEREGDIGAEETLMGLGDGAEALLQPPHLTDEQIIVCAVIGAETGNATTEELGALHGTRPGLTAALDARGGSSVLGNLDVTVL